MPSHTRDLEERLFAFLCAVIGFVRTMRPEPGVRKIADQLVDAAGSIAANREEATSGSSRKEFVRFNEIALRSAKEAALWLRVCQATSIGEPSTAQALHDEGRQLAKILGAIVINTKRNPPPETPPPTSRRT
jgi:four helix bundle protein